MTVAFRIRGCLTMLRGCDGRGGSERGEALEPLRVDAYELRDAVVGIDGRDWE